MDKHAKHFQQGDGQSKIRTVEHIFLHLPTSCNLELFAALSYNLNRQPPHNTTLSIYCRFSNWNHSNGFFIWNHALGLLKIYPQYHAAAPPCLPQTIVTQNDIFRSKHFQIKFRDSYTLVDGKGWNTLTKLNTYHSSLPSKSDWSVKFQHWNVVESFHNLDEMDNEEDKSRERKYYRNKSKLINYSGVSI